MNEQLIIDLDKILLMTYDKSNDGHRQLLLNFNGESQCDFISLIDSRLELNSNGKSFPFNTAFVVSLASGELVGYVFISSRRQDEVYLEYSLLQEQRGKGYGKMVLGLVTEYLFCNYNIRDVALDIDVSNESSMRTAISCGFYEDEYLETGKCIYRSYNLGYVDKRRKGSKR